VTDTGLTRNPDLNTTKWWVTLRGAPFSYATARSAPLAHSRRPQPPPSPMLLLLPVLVPPQAPPPRVILRALHVVLATTIYLRQPIIDCRFVSPRRCSCVCNGATASACGALDLHDSGQSGLTLSTKKPNMNRDWTAVVNVGRVGVGIATTSGGTRAVTTDVPLHDDARPLGKMPETFAAMVSHALPAPTSSAATALAQHSTPTYPHARARAFIHTHTHTHTHTHIHTIFFCFCIICDGPLPP
jgi:hypothetical protein